MAQKMIDLGHGFWNIRGSFKIAGLIDVGTQASLVRTQQGRFILLDTCAFDKATLDAINALTDNGSTLDAVINLHPFHTLHVEATHQLFPKSRLYGTARHHERLPSLPWEAELTESAALHRLFEADLEFSVPDGVEFISDNDKVHFSSVLAWHPASKTIHVDDTLMYIRWPLPLRLLGHKDSVRFHPTLSKVLRPEAGSGHAFAEWATGLANRWRDAENLCAAHVSALLGTKNGGARISDRILTALDDVRPLLAAGPQERQD